MKLNEDKCHFMIFGERTNHNFSIYIGNCTINKSQEEKLLGVFIDANLNFGKHVSTICKKADKLRLLMRAFVTSQFQYCPLVWMFHSGKMNNKINRLHERALRISHKDHTSSVVSLLEQDRSAAIHQKNLQLLMTKLQIM